MALIIERYSGRDSVLINILIGLGVGVSVPSFYVAVKQHLPKASSYAVESTSEGVKQAIKLLVDKILNKLR